MKQHSRRGLEALRSTPAIQLLAATAGGPAQPKDDYMDAVELLDLYMRDMGSQRALSPPEARALIDDWPSGDDAAGKVVTRSLLPIVIERVERRRPADAEVQLRLMQEGNLALVRALGDYDASGQQALDTYVRAAVDARLSGLS